MFKTGGHPSRRQVLVGLAGAAGIATLLSPPAAAAEIGDKNSLAAIAAEKGILFGASFAVHELDAPHGTAYAEIYERDARILTSELAFKLQTLRPTPDKIDFYEADRLVDFAEKHAMRIRGHTLIWNDALPDWIKALPDDKVRALLDAHIETVTTRYGERVVYWDVVNEPIGPWDRNPGNLRAGPFYRAFGEGYIKRAFDVARKFAPNATLVLNEAQTETQDDNGATFRDSLLGLLKRLKSEGTPIDAVGIQSHLMAAAHYDFAAYAGFLSEIADLGYAIHLTELDVNDFGIDGSIAERDAKVAALYEGYLTEVLKLNAVKIVELWQLSDGTSWMHDASATGRIEVRRDARPLIYDDKFRKKPAWDAVARALSNAPARSA
jgi:endo-1,4-beta-xylanase